MKNIKYIILLFLFLTLVGCKQEYNLVVTDTSITEEFKITVDNNEDNLKRLNVKQYPLHANNDILYNKKITKNGKIISAIFNYFYKPYDFVNANSFNQCFKNKKVIVDDEKYYEFNFSDMMDCMYNYNMNINIITKNKVVSHNADKVKGNKYTWYLTDDNKDKFSIEIKIEKGTAKNILEQYKILTYVVVGIVSFGIILGVFIVIKKIRKNNKV